MDARCAPFQTYLLVWTPRQLCMAIPSVIPCTATQAAPGRFGEKKCQITPRHIGGVTVIVAADVCVSCTDIRACSIVAWGLACAGLYC